MKAGMKSDAGGYPPKDQVLAGLGDKLPPALATAVDLTRDDLTAYRQWRPLWVASHSERGLAAWIHDRLWMHLVALLDGVPDVTLTDREPLREIGVGYNYKLRIKRHDLDDGIKTYPTQTALEFLAQVPGQLPFDGMEEVHLIGGYRWIKDERQIGEAIISLRDGTTVIWTEILSGRQGGTAGGTTLPVTPLPTPPQIDTSGVERSDDEQETT